MALTDVVFASGLVHNANRGNVGSVVDAEFHKGMSYNLSLTVPTVDKVMLGTNYGQQGTSLTGTLTGGGGPGGAETVYIFQS